MSSKCILSSQRTPPASYFPSPDEDSFRTIAAYVARHGCVDLIRLMTCCKSFRSLVDTQSGETYWEQVYSTLDHQFGSCPYYLTTPKPSARSWMGHTAAYFDEFNPSRHTPAACPPPFSVRKERLEPFMATLPKAKRSPAAWRRYLRLYGEGTGIRFEDLFKLVFDPDGDQTDPGESLDLLLNHYVDVHLIFSNRRVPIGCALADFMTDVLVQLGYCKGDFRDFVLSYAKTIGRDVGRAQRDRMIRLNRALRRILEAHGTTQRVSVHTHPNLLAHLQFFRNFGVWNCIHVMLDDGLVPRTGVAGSSPLDITSRFLSHVNADPERRDTTLMHWCIANDFMPSFQWPWCLYVQIVKPLLSTWDADCVEKVLDYYADAWGHDVRGGHLHEDMQCSVILNEAIAVSDSGTVCLLVRRFAKLGRLTACDVFKYCSPAASDRLSQAMRDHPSVARRPGAPDRCRLEEAKKIRRAIEEGMRVTLPCDGKSMCDRCRVFCSGK